MGLDFVVDVGPALAGCDGDVALFDLNACQVAQVDRDAALNVGAPWEGLLAGTADYDATSIFIPFVSAREIAYLRTALSHPAQSP